MSKEQLIAVAKNNLAHAEAGTIAQTEEFLKVPAANYYCPERWQQEMNQIFKRVPLLLATTAELPNPGDYKALEAAGSEWPLAAGTLVWAGDAPSDEGAWLLHAAHAGHAFGLWLERGNA